MGSRLNTSLVAVGGTVGIGAVIVYVAFILSALATFVASLGTSINVAVYHVTGNFLFAHLWFASSYATVAPLFFYLTLVAANVWVLIRNPLAVVLSIPFSIFMYAVVTGSVDLLHAHLTTETPVGVFTQNLLTGVIYSAVGASAVNELFDSDDDDDDENSN